MFIYSKNWDSSSVIKVFFFFFFSLINLQTRESSLSWTPWIIFHCLTCTLNRIPPPTQPPVLLKHWAVFRPNPFVLQMMDCVCLDHLPWMMVDPCKVFGGNVESKPFEKRNLKTPKFNGWETLMEKQWFRWKPKKLSTTAVSYKTAQI